MRVSPEPRDTEDVVMSTEATVTMEAYAPPAPAARAPGGEKRSSSFFGSSPKAGKDAAAVADDEKPSRIERYADKINGAITGAFFSLGHGIAASPRKAALCALALCLVCAGGIGYPGLENESRSEKLWIPADTQAQDDKAYVDNYFGTEARFGEVIIKRADGTSVLTPATLNSMQTLVDKIEAASVVYDGATISWTDQCYYVGSTCFIEHLNNAFSSTTDRDTASEIIAKVNLASIPNVVTSGTIDLDKVAGGITYSSGSVTEASALRISFLTKVHETLVDGRWEDPRGEAYERVLLDIFEAGVDGLELSYIVSRSFSDEFGDAITGDLVLLQAAFVLILGYATLMLSKWDEGCVGTRLSVTLAGIVAVGMAIASSYGFCSYCGLFYSPLMNVLPFLLLGIGVDDMFVIVTQYDLLSQDSTYRDGDLRTRIGRAMGVAGASITVTSMTDMFAFLIGSNTSLPALRNFCFYAAAGVFFVFVYQCTWFAAWLTIDEWRREKNKRDVCCCCVGTKSPCLACCDKRKDGKTRVQHFMGESLGGTLTKPWAKGLVVGVFTAIAIVGFVGCARMKIEADVNDFIPEGSYLKDWLSDSDYYFTKVGDAIALYTNNIQINTAENSKVLRLAVAAFKGDAYVSADATYDWVTAWDADGTRGTVDTAYSYSSLKTWLDGSGAAYANDVKWVDSSNPASGIYSARVRGNHVKTATSDEKVKSMDSLRATLSGVAGNGDGRVFAYSASWLNYEQYKTIEEEALRNISSTMAVMVAIIAFLLVNPKAVLVVCLCLCLIIINIIGYMYFWDLNFDSVTIIMLIIALGLSVDYAAHIGRAYLETRGSPDERLKACLNNMGAAVFNGAFSTFLAVAVLGGSQSYVFITFFRQLFLCITLGLSHGLILLPVLMSLVNPKPYAQHTAAY